MATVTITLADDGTEDGVLFRAQFDPPLEDDTILTPAQSEAGWLIEVMQRHANGESLSSIAEDMDEESHEIELALGQVEEEEENPN